MAEKIHFENNGLYSFGPFRLDATERKLLKAGVPVALTRKLFDLLLILVEAGGHLQTREELIEALWPKNIVEAHGLTNKLHSLRKALGDDGESPVYIETVHGIGYRFIAPVSVETRAQTAQVDNPRSGRRIRPTAVLSALITLAVLAIGITSAVLLTQEQQAAARVAVLPFENLSANDKNAYFAAGIQDTILTRLAAIQGIRVISRTSSDTYPSHPASLQKIARELGVTAVLEGSVQHIGKRVLINVQLIDAQTDTHLWAASYARTLDDVFDVEGTVAQQVATALSDQLQPREIKRLAKPATRNPGAYVLFLKANYEADRVFARSNATNSRATVQRAVGLYKQAIALDPRFALAYARLSILESRIFWFNPAGLAVQHIEPAKADSKRALALDRDLPQAWMAAGYIAYYGELNYPRALVLFARAKELSPNNAAIISAIAQIHRRQGDMQSALRGLHQVIRLDPRNPHWPELIGTTLMALRRYDEAGQWLDRALAQEPENFNALIRKANLTLMMADGEKLEHIAAKIPPNVVPGLIPELRFQAAYLRRDADGALKVLSRAPAWVTGTNTIPHLPSSLLKADAWRLKGDKTQARRFYLLARDEIMARLRANNNNPPLKSAYGMAQAGLGNRASAIAAGSVAASWMPTSRDAMLGAFYLAALARIYARLDEAGPAVTLLERLFSLPAGRAISVRLLEVSPLWDGIRNDPRFKALLKKYSRRSVNAVARTTS